MLVVNSSVAEKQQWCY